VQRREQLLGDVLEFYDHMRVPLSSLERDTRQGEYRYYGAQGVIDHIDNYIYDGQFVLIAEDGANLVTRNEPIAFLVEGQFWVNNHAHVVKGKEGVADDYYVTRLLNSMNIAGFITGAAQPKLSQQNLKQIKVGLPPYDAQRRIADILSAYDDLIESNRRRMALLEEAARQLYGEWFVRLRFPGHEHTRITNGVPEGWERRTLAEACSSLEDGDWIETKDQGGGDYRLLQISNIGINEFVETGNYRYVTEQTFKRLNCRELLPGHILIARMPKPIGRAWLITEMPWRMITAVDAAIAIANEELADAYFLTHYLNSPASLEHCERRAVGATRPRIARRELAALPLLLPPRRLQAHFREFAEPPNQQRAVLYRQNQKLRAARDLLLPRLMSGAVAV
jgi:type I restriction enzyme S subunit